MAQGRTWLIPWNQYQAGGFDAEATAGLGGSHHKRTVKIVYKDSVGEPLANIGVGYKTRIHIAGHGSIGGTTISCDHGQHGADRSAADLVELMQQLGLKKRYIGTIVTDVCYSALGDPCFAKQLARALYGAGYKGTCVMGFKGPLGAAYGSELGGKYTHRVVDIEDDDGNVVETVKSKHAKKRFWGFN